MLAVLAASGAVLFACLHYAGPECKSVSGPGEEISTSSSRPASTAPVVPPIAGNWKLIYQDEFDSNPLISGYVLKMWGKAGIGCEIDDPTNVTVADGILSLTAARFGKGFTSGQVHTGGNLLFGGSTPPRFTFKFGYLEARLRVPTGHGLWPVFWLMPTPNPDLHDADGEIDVFDNGDGDPAHMCVGSDAHGKKFRHDRVVQLLPGFHRIGIDWQADRISWYVDGKAVMINDRVETIPQVDEYVIFGLQINDGVQWGPPPDVNTQLPDSFKVDYVRVWQRTQPK